MNKFILFFWHLAMNITWIKRNHYDNCNKLGKYCFHKWWANWRKIYIDERYKENKIK